MYSVAYACNVCQNVLVCARVNTRMKYGEKNGKIMCMYACMCKVNHGANFFESRLTFLEMGVAWNKQERDRG